MAESSKTDRERDERPYAHRDRGLVSEGPEKGQNRSANTSHDPDSARLDKNAAFGPDREGTGS